MDFDFAALSADDRYKLLVSLVVPRPIALVTTRSSTGRVNAAPFSFFNVLSDEPPLVILSVDGRDEDPDTPKDTARNIRETGAFVVNLVDQALVPAMTVCAVAFPAEVDETEAAGLTLVPSAKVAVPRIAAAPVQLECVEWQSIPIATGRHLVLGQVVHLHVRDGIVGADLRVDMDKLDLVGRMHGGGWYVRTHDRFEAKRLTLADVARSAPQS
jgi:flavin reductase (DIM6/NTAB) family NADH-FMN oxidoreductase RutF